MDDGTTLRLLANLSDQAIGHAPDGPAGTLIWGNELGDSVPPWTVLWRIG
jgi:maltooligosyltrehalose trehalohydrolase